jgi:DNA-directed RNA polymerase subunit H (RpoH/RPB5)
MQRLFDIKKTQLEMVRDRGYEISPDEELIFNMDIYNFTAYINELATANPRVTTRSLLSRSYQATLPDGSIRSMLIYYGGKTDPRQKLVAAEVVREFIGLVQRYRITEAILIVDAALSSTGGVELSALTLTKWQVFFDSELTYNPTRHVDTPPHELLSPEQAQAKLRELRVDLSKLLIIKVNDPVVRYYGWTAGNIVRVHRDDQTISILSPKSINYRVIVG